LNGLQTENLRFASSTTTATKEILPLLLLLVLLHYVEPAFNWSTGDMMSWHGPLTISTKDIEY